MASRRDFLATLGAGTALAACRDSSPPAAPLATKPSPDAAAAPEKKPPPNQAPDLGEVKLAMRGPLPRRALGKTGLEVSLLCLGGYHLGTVQTQAEAERIVHAAVDHGIDFFDNAWEYHDGKSEEWLGAALVGRRDKVKVMTKVCTHGRDKRVATTQLEDSLRRLRTDHIDLWQVHEVIYPNDPELHYQAGGVLEALLEARQAGKVRFVGFTGHKHPAIHLDMLARGFAFDAVQMPINVFDGAGYLSFEKEVLPVAQKRGLAILGMKSLGGGGDAIKKGVVTHAEALGYALSQPISSLVSGVDSLAVLHQNLNFAGGFQPLDAAAQEALREKVRPLAADGRFELFKSSKKYDGPPGREQHGFPPPEELGT